ncbi:DUF1156 domain-containing protein [Rhodobacterales bacterium HKCCA1288]|nr:DUF1156 domain-containing protein [Rhodobacterales bacterium HKCCA1288]
MTQTYKKKLIEVAIPLEAINTASMKEKTNPFLKGHPRALHQWWARRPLPACRAILFAQLVDDPSNFPDVFPTESEVLRERQRLFTIIEDLIEWNNSSNPSVLKRAADEIEKSTNGELPTVLDPFSGGGAIPFEAQRLGLKTVASDLNPVAALISKAMIDFPARFSGRPPVHDGAREKHSYEQSEGLSEDIRYYGKVLRDLAEEKIGKYYPTISIKGSGEMRVAAWLWSRTVPSPDPAFGGAHVPIAATFVLSKKKGAEAFIEPVVDKSSGKVDFLVRYSGDKDLLNTAAQGTKKGRGANFVCLLSNSPITPDYVKKCGQRGEIGTKLMCIVAEGDRKRIYASPTVEHERIATHLARPDINEITLPQHSQYIGVLGYGMSTFSDLFSPRQAMCLKELIDLLPEVRDRVEEDINISRQGAGESFSDKEKREYIRAINLYLGFAIDKLADFMNAHCGWNAANENISHMFGRHVIPMVWDYVEGNPFGGMIGIDSICRSVSGGLANAGLGLVGDVQHTSAQTVSVEEKCVVVSTDPPYYDNIPYADISDFFYGLLRKSQKFAFPEIISTLSAPKSEELVADRVRYGGPEAAESFFLDGMTQAMVNLQRQASDDFPITIYYAFKQNEIETEGVASTGWATFLQAVFDADLSVVGTWPIRTENSVRRRASKSNALANSVVLVCRRKVLSADKITRAEFIRALKRELPPAIAELQAANVSPADMPQSAIGPGMGVFSRYKAVLEADDNPMTVKTALQLINAELDEFLNDLHGEFDADTRFAATWFEQHGNDKGDYGSADNLARARGISVESVKHAGIVESSAGKVRILKRSELDADWDPLEDDHLTIWECCQHLIRVLENDGEYAAAVLVKKIGSDKAETVKDLAYYLYEVCSTKRQDAKEATAYNGLIAVWTELTRQAATIQIEDQYRQSAMDI